MLTDLTDSVEYANSNGVINKVYFPKLFGWKFENTTDEAIILTNLSTDTVIVSVSKNLEKNFSAKSIMNLISLKTNLKGGGKDDFAQAGGELLDKPEFIFDEIKNHIKSS